MNLQEKVLFFQTDIENKDKFFNILDQIIKENNLEKVFEKINRIYIIEDYELSTELYIKLIDDNLGDADFISEMLDCEFPIGDWRGLTFTDTGHLFVNIYSIKGVANAWFDNSKRVTHSQESFTEYEKFGVNLETLVNTLFWTNLLHEIYHMYQVLEGLELSCIDATDFSKKLINTNLIKKDYIVL